MNERDYRPVVLVIVLVMMLVLVSRSVITLRDAKSNKNS